MPAILTELARQRLVLPGAGGIEVLGLTGRAVLESTTRIFNESSHEKHEEIVIEVSDAASESPITDKSAVESLSDEFKIPPQDVLDTLQLGCNIGFFDSEAISPTEKLLFNGNLFRREDARKVNGVLSNLAPADASQADRAERKATGNWLPTASISYESSGQGFI